MITYIKIFLFTSLVFAVQSTTFGKNVNIHIIVLDSENNKVVPNAIVKIVELSKSFTCNDNGELSIPKLDYGIYTFAIHHISYEENVSNITIDENSNKKIVFYLIPKTIQLDPVVIADYKSYSTFDDLRELSNVLKGKNLQKQLGLTLAATLKNEAGLSMRSMGPAPSRPVIRGLGSNRVVISEDGIKTVDLSATSPDHAVTIDPFTIERIEVLRGPKILTQSSTTIGGIVNTIRNEIPKVQHDDLIGSIGSYVETVNQGFLGSAMIEYPISDFSFRTEISKRKTNDLKTPIKKLKNSDSENLNYSFSGSYFPSFGVLGISYRNFELDYGVPGGFVGAHPKGVDIEIKKNQFNILNDIKIDNENFENIEIALSRVYYRHKEYESSGAIGSEFEIENYIGKIDLNIKKFTIFTNGILGLNFEYENFNVGGFVFTPPSKHYNLSTYLFENFDYKKIKFEFGARYNFDQITPDKNNPDSKIGFIRKRIFNTYSLSASALYEISNIVYIGTNLSKSSRTPTVEELFSQGPHLAAYSFEIGNPNLKDESGFGAEVFIYHNFQDFYFNLTFFRNDLTNYIIPRNIGETNYATFLPIYQTSGVEAILQGFENRIDWNICNCLKISNTISFTEGKFKSDGYLPQIPPLKGLLEITYKSDYLNFGVSNEWALAQNNVDEFEEPTKGYFVNNLFLQYSFSLNGLINNISFNVDNIFDQEYRNHLSRVKSILPEAGRNFRLSYKMYFHM
ncbi:MAG: TonB-dependent receptor [Ignavibacteriae bacterium]|nr:TonB-dependent receptor [Ignavibacteriota bacterium]